MEQLPLIDDLPLPQKNKTAAKKSLCELRQREPKVTLASNFKLVGSMAQLEDIAVHMEQSEACVLDVETRKIPWQRGSRVTALNVYTPSNQTAYMIPVRMVHATRNFADHEVAETLGPAIEDHAIKKIGHNFKFDMHHLRETFGLEVGGFDWDTLLGSILLNENENHDLESLCVKYCKASDWKISHAAPFETWPINIATQYGCKDAEANWHLYQFQIPHFEKRPRLAALRELEQEVVKIAYSMEYYGVGWDYEYYDKEMRPFILAQCEQAKQKLYDQVGKINLNAPEELALALFGYTEAVDKLRVPVMLNIPRVNENHTDKEVLLTLVKRGYTIAQDILDWRKWSTIDKMFVSKLPDHVVNGRIHCSFNTIGTEHGRFAAKKPNLQQIPKVIGPIIRRGFIPSPGCVFVSIDYSQQELRMAAHLSGDEGLITAFCQGIDIHTAVMRDVLHVSLTEYARTPQKFEEQRRQAKAVNFGLLYGIGAEKLAWQLGLEIQTARDLVRDYFASYPRLPKFINNTHVEAGRNGYVETILGRKRRLPAAKYSKNRMEVALAEREAVNAKISGSCADITKLALCANDRWIKDNHWPYTLLLQVHDELIYEVNEEWLTHHQSSMKKLSEIMTSVHPLRVPLVAEPEILRRWGDKIKMHEDIIQEEM